LETVRRLALAEVEAVLEDQNQQMAVAREVEVVLPRLAAMAEEVVLPRWAATVAAEEQTKKVAEAALLVVEHYLLLEVEVLVVMQLVMAAVEGRLRLERLEFLAAAAVEGYLLVQQREYEKVNLLVVGEELGPCWESVEELERFSDQ
jgi:hypothetical protein